MIGIKELIQHIQAVARDEGLTVQNLQVQKIAFFIFGKSTQEINNIRYDMVFERWKYGPVIPSFYYELNRCGGGPSIPIGDECQQLEELTVFNQDILLLLRKDPYILVEYSHRLPSWLRYHEEILAGIKVPSYTLEDIRTDFAFKKQKNMEE